MLSIANKCIWYDDFPCSPSQEVAWKSCEDVTNQLEFPACLSLRRPWTLVRSPLDVLLNVTSVRSLGLYRLDQLQGSLALEEVSAASDSFVNRIEINMGDSHEVSVIGDGPDALSPAGILERTSLGGMIRESQVPDKRCPRVCCSPIVSPGLVRCRSKRNKVSVSPGRQETEEAEMTPQMTEPSSVNLSVPVVGPTEDLLVEVNPLAHQLAAWDEEPEAVRKVAPANPAEGESFSSLATAPVARVRLSTRPRLTKHRYNGESFQEDPSSEVTR